MSPYSSDMEGSPQPNHEHLGFRNVKHRQEVEANIRRHQEIEDSSVWAQDMGNASSPNTLRVTPKKSAAKKKHKALGFVAAHGGKVPGETVIKAEPVEEPKEPNRPKKIKNRSRSTSTSALADGGEQSWEDVDLPVDPLSIPHSFKSKGKNAKTPNKNGRYHGRQLVNWHRARMMEKFILHLQYECQREGKQLPWDKAVHRLMPGSSGTAALQYLNRLRGFLVTEGHMVPPLIGKLGTPQDSSIRGYIRDMSSDDITQTRPVKWDEQIEDLKESLVVPGVIRGSGVYRQKMVEVRQPESGDGAAKRTAIKVEDVESGSSFKNPKSTPRKRRAHNPIPCVKYPSPESTSDNAVSNNIPKTPKRKLGATKRLSKSKDDDLENDADEVDPADLASDDEYNPQLTKKVRTGHKPARKSSQYVMDLEDSDATASNEEERDPFTTPKTRINRGPIGGLMTPHSPSDSTPSGLVKLQLNPAVLKSFQTRCSDNQLLKSMLKSSFKSSKQPNDTFIDSDNKEYTAFWQNSPSASRSNRLAMLNKGDPFIDDDVEQQSGNVYASFDNETGIASLDFDYAKTELSSPRSHLDEHGNQSLAGHQKDSSLAVYSSRQGKLPDMFYNQDSQDFSSHSMQAVDIDKDMGPEFEFNSLLADGYDNSFSFHTNVPLDYHHYLASTKSQPLGGDDTLFGSSQNSTYDDDVFYSTPARSAPLNSSLLNPCWDDGFQQQSSGGNGRSITCSGYQQTATPRYNGGSYYTQDLPQHEEPVRGSTNTVARHALPQMYEASPFADVSQFNTKYDGDFNF